VIRPIADDINRAACRLRILTTLLGHLSPDRELRDAAQQAETLVAAAKANILMRPDIALLVAAVYEKEEIEPDVSLDDQDRHLLAHIHGEYVRSGAFLRSDEERKELRAALEQISDLRAAAQASFTEEEDGIWFERSTLEGVPENILEAMAQEGAQIQVTFRNDQVTAIMRHAVSSETRRRFYVAQQNRLPENVTRLENLVALRDQVARLLGFEHHAALRIRDKMAPSVAYVESQLAELHKRLKPLAQAETDRLLQLKQRDFGAEELYSWDRAYYLHNQNQENVSVNHELLREYFEAYHTLQGILDVFRDLFGIKFERIETSVWHKSVVAYEAWDTANEGGQFLGHLYVDILDRKGKYRGAHHVLIQPVSLLWIRIHHNFNLKMLRALSKRTAKDITRRQHWCVALLIQRFPVHRFFNTVKLKPCFMSLDMPSTTLLLEPSIQSLILETSLRSPALCWRTGSGSRMYWFALAVTSCPKKLFHVT
jgi:metallopeptidase MepB